MSPTSPTLHPIRCNFRHQWERLALAERAKVDQFQYGDAVSSHSGLTLRGLADYLQRTYESTREISMPAPVKPHQLAELARNFHKRAGTYTDAVESSVNNYIGAAPSLRAAHQPNFLASLNVVGQAALCEALANQLNPRPVQVFFIVDYDICTDRRYRHSKLPSLSSRSGYHSLSVENLHEDEKMSTFMFGEMKPPPGYLEEFSRRLTSYSSHDHSVIRKVLGFSATSRGALHQRQAQLKHQISAAYENAASTSDANSRFLSWCLNVFLGLPTLFVPGSMALPMIVDHVRYLWSRSREYYAACEQVAAELEDIGIIVSRGLVQSTDIAPFWMQCQNDRSRVAMFWADRTWSKAKGTCSRCKGDMQISLKSMSDISYFDCQPAIVPRVIWDDLLDGFAWGHLGGCSYRGGLEHYLFTAAVANRLNLPTLPEFISHSARPPEPTSEFEETAKLIAKSSGSSEGQGGAIALNLITSGVASMVHSILWNPAINAQDIARTFESDR